MGVSFLFILLLGMFYAGIVPMEKREVMLLKLQSLDLTGSCQTVGLQTFLNIPHISCFGFSVVTLAIRVKLRA